MPNVLPLTIRPGALPPNAKYTPQQFLDALATALQIESQQEFALFVSGAIEPVYNAGPFLLNGITWRVWKDGIGGYGPLVLEQESLKYILSATEPDETKYDVWIKLDGAGKGQGIFKYYSGAWTDVYADVFYSKAAIDTMVAGAVPTGVILPYGGATAPTGYLACNNQAVSRATYAALFAVIGTSYGAGDLVTTFNVPDLRGRTMVGMGTGDAADATAWTRGQKQGREGVTLTTAQIPAHSHDILGYGFSDNGSTGPLDETWGVSGRGTDDQAEYFSDNPSDRLFIKNAGGGDVHTNLQPSLGVNAIIKF
jgi:microcystin-dependent protein